MLTFRITVWKYKPLLTAGEVQDAHPVFDMTLDKLKDVMALHSQLNGLERGMFRGGSAMVDCYRYRFAFCQNGKPVQTYSGSTNVGAWIVDENSRRANIYQPRAILQSLHESIGLPVWTQP